MHRLAKATYRIPGTGGSNPPLSASFSFERSRTHRCDARLMTKRAPKQTLLLALAAFGAACQSAGPTLTIENPSGHVVYIDGRQVLDGRGEAAEADRELPFRYYGATRCDVIPRVAERDGVPIFDQRIHSIPVALPPPASPWLFPLDLPLEAIDRLFHGRRDVVITAVATPRDRMEGSIPQEQLGELSARARAARSER